MKSPSQPKTAIPLILVLLKSYLSVAAMQPCAIMLSTCLVGLTVDLHRAGVPEALNFPAIGAALCDRSGNSTYSLLLFVARLNVQLLGCVSF